MKSSELKAARAARAATAARAVTGAEASKASSSSDSCPAADTVSVGPQAEAVVIEVPGFPSRRKKAGKSLSVTCSFGGVSLSIPTHTIDRWAGTSYYITLQQTLRSSGDIQEKFGRYGEILNARSLARSRPELQAHFHVAVCSGGPNHQG